MYDNENGSGLGGGDDGKGWGKKSKTMKSTAKPQQNV